MNKLYNTFENQLREKMVGHEMPYDPRDWNDLQSNLRPKGRSMSAILVALFATFTVVGGASVIGYHNFNQSSTAKIASNKDLGTATTNSIGQTAITEAAINTLIQETATSNGTWTANKGTNTASNGGFIASPSDMNQAVESNGNTSSIDGNWNQVSPIIPEEPRQNLKKQLAFAPNVSMACAGTAVEFKVTSLPDGVTGNYIWNFGDGKFKAETAPSNVYTKPGHYDVSLSITDDNGRITTTVLNKAIVIVPTPKADFSWHFDNLDPAHPTVKIINTSENANSAEWTMKDGTKLNEINPSLDLNANGKQMLALQVTNQYGCSNGTVKHISINSDLNLGAANTLKVSNDLFMPEALKSNKHNFVLTIFDMQGNAIYETINRNKGWDGSLTAGLHAAAGETYQWRVLVINDLTKEEKYFNGTLSIIP